MKSVNRTHETIPFHTITGVDLKRKLGSGWIVEFSRAANIDSLLKCDGTGSNLFVQNLKNSMRDLNQSQGKSTPSNQEINPLDQLKQLAELLDAGIISQEEFDEKKKSLIERI
jgi:predicted DNA-binding ArsR family transcriptional regulator